MVWVDMGWGAVVGGLIAAVFGPLIKRKWKTESSRRLAFTIVFTAALGVSQVFLAPVARAFSDAAALDDALQKTSAFVVLKTYDPATYRSLTKSMRDGLKAGASRAQVVAEAQAKMRTIVMSKLPATSDAAAVTYMKASIASMEHLYRSGGDMCYAYMFPTQGKALDPTKELTPDILQAELAALAEVLRTALVSPQLTPDDAAFEAAASKSFLKYLQANSAELGTLEEPKATEQERRRACEAGTAMYKKIVELPTPAAGTVIRYMLAPQDAPQ